MSEEANEEVIIDPQFYQLNRGFAYFTLDIVNIDLPLQNHVITPELITDNKTMEYVYDIHDYGKRLAISNVMTNNMSMCKFYYTIEKIIYLLVDKLSNANSTPDAEIAVNIYGTDSALRKAFESIINLEYNVVVQNFDPGDWGSQYLRNVKTIADAGFDYPSKTPRDIYRVPHNINKT